MPQHDYDLANAPGSVFRADINSALLAIVGLNSGPTPPTTTFAYMLWADTANGVLKRRNSSNSGWVVCGPLASTMVQSVSGAKTVTLADFGAVLDCSGNFTISFDAASSLGDGFTCAIRNSGSGTVVVDPTESIDGLSTINVAPGESFIVFCNGSNFRTIGRTSFIFTADNTFTGSNAFSGQTYGVEKPLPATSGNITLDLRTGNNFGGTLTGNITLTNPTNKQVGQSGHIRLVNNGSAGISFGSQWKTAGGVAPDLTKTNGAVDVIYYEVLTTSLILYTMQKDVK